MLMSQAGNPLPPEPASSGKCVVTLPRVLRQAELLRGVAGIQCSQEAGQLEAGVLAPAPGVAAHLGDALPTSSPGTQEREIYEPDLLPAVRSADEKVLCRN